MRILVVDDDVQLCRIVRRGLQEEGHAVDAVFDGLEALQYAVGGPYDLIILDVMLPGMDGFEVCRRLRQSRLRAAILMLTARDAVGDRIAGLDTGADDYLVKPFEFAELLARVRALLRRDGGERSAELRSGDLLVDTRTHGVRRGGRSVELTTKEFAMLEYLMRNAGAVVTRRMLEEHVWDYEFDSLSNLVDVYVGRLRRKLDREGEESIIETLRGLGYRLRTL